MHQIRIIIKKRKNSYSNASELFKFKNGAIIFIISLLVMIIGAGIFLLVKWLQDDGENEKKGKIGEVNCIFQ